MSSLVLLRRCCAVCCAHTAFPNPQAQLFPACYFVIGFDTAVRLVDTKYYRDDVYVMCEALSSIKRAGCKCVFSCPAVRRCAVLHGTALCLFCAVCCALLQSLRGFLHAGSWWRGA